MFDPYLINYVEMISLHFNQEFRGKRITQESNRFLNYASDLIIESIHQIKSHRK